MADSLSSIHICNFSDPHDYRIVVDGHEFLFDFSERFGPSVIGKRGGEIAQPKPRHKFWIAVTLWHKQGKRVSEDGICVWDWEDLDGTTDLKDFVQVGKRTWVHKSLIEKLKAKER